MSDGNFELPRFRYFIKVAELGSLTHAAKVLHIARPALSQHMQNIEDELGLKLLERGPRGVRLTEAGQRLAIEARDLLSPCVPWWIASRGIPAIRMAK